MPLTIPLFSHNEPPRIHVGLTRPEDNTTAVDPYDLEILFERDTASMDE